jgi:hypothetical protein
VRAAPNWKMTVGWEGLTVGEKIATAVVGNALVRAMVARSPVWARGGLLGHARRRARERRAAF